MSPFEGSTRSSEGVHGDIAPLEGVGGDIAPIDPAARASAGAHAGASNGAARPSSTDPASIASLAPREATAGAVCASCDAPLAPDQRYCLACGQPASPVRLAFLDVLQGEYQPGAAASYGSGVPGAPPPLAHYAPPPQPDGLLGALRRYSGLFALTGVLLAALLIGLLVGHWITGGNGAAAAGKQVIEVKGLDGAPLAPTATNGAASGSGSSSANHSSSASQSHQSAKDEAKQEAKEAAAIKVPPPVQKKTNPTSLQKLDKTTGKQHVKEVNEQFKGNEPIETGH